MSSTFIITRVRQLALTLTLIGLALSGCAPVSGSCDAACTALCDRMKSCNAGDTSESCATSCKASLSSDTQCKETGAQEIQNLTCDEVQTLVQHAEYCSTVCARGAECGSVTDTGNCELACGQSSSRYKMASIEARNCTQINKETSCYKISSSSSSSSSSSPSDSDHKTTTVPLSPGGDGTTDSPRDSTSCGSLGGELGDVCASPSECRDYAMGCSAQTGTCAPCSSNEDCTASSSSKKYCRLSDHTCQTAGCFNESDCATLTSLPHCALDVYECSVCSNDTHCSGTTPYCRKGECVACETDADCPADRHHCDNKKACVACLLETDCQSDQTCYEQVCRKRCSKDWECGLGECYISRCTDPVGTTCDETVFGACGNNSDCVHVDTNNLTVASYCTRSCGLTDDLPCPNGTKCTNFKCLKE